jgi:hypothetical protein
MPLMKRRARIRPSAPALALALTAARGLTQEAGSNEGESRVPAYTLPDPLRLLDGPALKSLADWRERRRPEVLALFQEHVYGRSPGMGYLPPRFRDMDRGDIQTRVSEIKSELRIG